MPCVKAIRAAGGAIDAATYKIGVDLCLAAAHGDLEQLKCFKAAGVDMTEKDYDGRTALHVVSLIVHKDRRSCISGRHSQPRGLCQVPDRLWAGPQVYGRLRNHPLL